MWRWWKSKKEKKRRLRVEFTETEFSLIRILAEHQNPETWIQQLVLARILPIQSQWMAQGKSRAILAAAYNSLEDQDIPDTKPERLKVLNNEHSCFFLDPEQPPQYRGQCFGTCTNPAQRGRVCFWSSVKAPECMYFEPRYVK